MSALNNRTTNSLLAGFLRKSRHLSFFFILDNFSRFRLRFHTFLTLPPKIFPRGGFSFLRFIYYRVIRGDVSPPDPLFFLPPPRWGARGFGPFLYFQISYETLLLIARIQPFFGRFQNPSGSRRILPFTERRRYTKCAGIPADFAFRDSLDVCFVVVIIYSWLHSCLEGYTHVYCVLPSPGFIFTVKPCILPTLEFHLLARFRPGRTTPKMTSHFRPLIMFCSRKSSPICTLYFATSNIRTPPPAFSKAFVFRILIRPVVGGPVGKRHITDQIRLQNLLKFACPYTIVGLGFLRFIIIGLEMISHFGDCRGRTFSCETDHIIIRTPVFRSMLILHFLVPHFVSCVVRDQHLIRDYLCL